MKHLLRLIRFGAVGVVNTGVYYASYLVLHIKLVYLVAHVIAFLIAMVVSYFLNCYITFQIRPTWKTFLLFPLSNAASFVIMTAGLQVAVGELHMNSRIAPLAVALVAIPITYLVANVIMVERRQGHRVPEQDVAGMPARTDREPRTS